MSNKLKALVWYPGKADKLEILMVHLEAATGSGQIYIHRADFLQLCGLSLERFTVLRARASTADETVVSAYCRIWTPASADPAEGGGREVYFALSDIPHIMANARLWSGKCGGSEQLAFLKVYAFYTTLLGASNLPGDEYEAVMKVYREQRDVEAMEKHWEDKKCGDIHTLANQAYEFSRPISFEDYPPKQEYLRESTIKESAGECSVIIPQIITQPREKLNIDCSDAVYTAKLQDAIEYMRQMHTQLSSLHTQLSSLQTQCAYYLEQFTELLKRH